MKNQEIVIIVPFFGKQPSYFPFFIKSCYANPDISFLIFADEIQPVENENVRIISFNLADFNALATMKLQLSVRLQTPYKVCDFRPAFGLIFEDFLSEARFWGTSDVDLIFGNIRQFVTDHILASYDVITAKREYLIGHFTLYRNNKKINRLYQKSADYRTVMQSPKSFAFDECNFLWWKLLAGADILHTRSQVESMSYVVKKYTKSGYIRSYFHSHVIEQDSLNSNGDLEPFWRVLRGIMGD